MTTDGPTRTWAALNRALLSRQLLLERVSTSAVEAVERVGGLQTQYAPSAYVGLWSRVAGFRRAELTEALHAARIVQGWVMRGTIHMVSAADYPPLTEAVREPRRRWWLRLRPEYSAQQMADAADVVGRALVDGPRKQADLVAALGAEGFPAAVFPGVQMYLDLVRVPPAGTWEQPGARVYGLAARWVPTGRLIARTVAVEHVLGRPSQSAAPPRRPRALCGARRPCEVGAVGRRGPRSGRDLESLRSTEHQ